MACHADPVLDPNFADAEQRAQTRDAYDRLAPVWSATTDDGPFNGGLERPALQMLIPRPLSGSTVLDAGCGSGGQCACCSIRAPTSLAWTSVPA